MTCKKYDNSNGTRVSIESGVEGPAHDPYGWDIITVYRKGHEYELESHSLGSTVFRIDGQEIAAGYDCHAEAKASRLFIDHTGGSPGDWMEWQNRAHSRCKCGSRKLESATGYPGECFVICSECGDIVNSHFNIGAVI